MSDSTDDPAMPTFIMALVAAKDNGSDNVAIEVTLEPHTAPSMEQAEQIASDLVLKTFPPDQGWRRHKTAVVQANKQPQN